MGRIKILLIFAVIGLLFIGSLTVKVKANPGITSDFVTLDSCDDPSVWTATGAGLISLNTVDYKQGAGAININKTGTTTVVFGANKTISSTDFRGKVLVIWFYFNSQSTLNKLTKAQVRIYDASGNYAYFNIANKTGWQAFRRIGNSPDGTSATAPDYSAIVKIQVYFESRSASDTITTGSIVMDYWHLGQHLIVAGAPSDNPDNFAKIYDYDQANALGLVERSGSTYIIYSALVFGDGATTSWFADTDCQVVVKGKDANGHAIISRAYAYIKFGTKLGKDGGTSGCQIRWENGDWCHDGSGTWHLYAYSTKLSGGVYWWNVGYDSEIFSSDLTDLRGYMDFRGPIKNTLISTKIYGRIGNSENQNVVIPFAEATLFPGNGWRIEYNIYRIRVIEWDPAMAKKAYISGNPSIYDSFWLDYTDICTDSTGSYDVYYYYSMPIYVIDKNGNPIPGATVTVTNNVGTSLTATSDSNGYAPIGYLLARKYHVDGSGVTIVTEGEPFHIQVKDSYGNNLLDTYIYVKEYKNWYLKPSYERLSIELKTEKGNYQLNENVIITAVPTDYIGNAIKGLSMKANVTKPDGTLVTISLKDDGISPDQVANDGTYTGQFTSTDQVGTYFVKVNTTIYGNVVTAKTSFDVGSIEQKIESANQSIISKLTSVNLSIITQLGKVNVSLSDLIKSANLSLSNLIKNANMTLADLIKSSNLTIIKQITNSTRNITVYINSTRVELESRLSDVLRAITSTNSTLEGKLSDILSRLKATSTRGTISLPAIPSPSFLAFANLPAITVSSVVMALLVFLFGILLYKKYREGK